MGPLRHFGVPAAAIPDIDILKDGGATWRQWLEAAQIPQVLWEGYQAQRKALLTEFKNSGKDMKRDGGTDVLVGSSRVTVDQLFDDLNLYGIFPVRSGELESWLKSMNVQGSKTRWAIAMLEALGSDPNSDSYCRPADDDVWRFMR